MDPKGVPDLVTIRLSSGMRRLVEEAAARRGICRTEYIRDAVRMVLAAERAEQSLDADIHLMLCRFGRAGLAYVETDPAEADATTVIQNLLYGRYGEPLRVVALNVSESWSRDVSEAMAYRVREIAEREHYELTKER